MKINKVSFMIEYQPERKRRRSHREEVRAQVRDGAHYRRDTAGVRIRGKTLPCSPLAGSNKVLVSLAGRIGIFVFIISICFPYDTILFFVNSFCRKAMERLKTNKKQLKKMKSNTILFTGQPYTY